MRITLERVTDQVWNGRIFQDWEATNPRDMVYALLGLNTGPRITCDYSISLRDLNIQVVKALIFRDRNLYHLFFQPVLYRPLRVRAGFRIVGSLSSSIQLVSQVSQAPELRQSRFIR